MKNGLTVIATIFLLTISGFALAKVIGGHSCCITNSAHHHQ